MLHLQQLIKWLQAKTKSQGHHYRDMVLIFTVIIQIKPVNTVCIRYTSINMICMYTYDENVYEVIRAQLNELQSKCFVGSKTKEVFSFFLQTPNRSCSH